MRSFWNTVEKLRISFYGHLDQMDTKKLTKSIFDHFEIHLKKMLSSSWNLRKIQQKIT